MFTSTKKFTPSNSTEVILSHMPKQCGCSACQGTKDAAKKELGEARFRSVCKALGLAA